MKFCNKKHHIIKIQDNKSMFARPVKQLTNASFSFYNLSLPVIFYREIMKTKNSVKLTPEKSLAVSKLRSEVGSAWFSLESCCHDLTNT